MQILPCMNLINFVLKNITQGSNTFGNISNKYSPGTKKSGLKATGSHEVHIL